MPLSWPYALSAASSVAGLIVLPLMLTASPFSKPISITVGLSGAALGIDRAGIDVSGRLLGRVLEHLALRGGVQKVGVGRERRLAALVLGDRDLVLLGVVDQRGARGEAPFAPGRDDLDVGLERIGRELEPHLVVALAGRAVGDGVGADLARDLDQALGDQRPGDRSAEQIKALVLRVGAEHREHVVAHELLAQILDEDVLGLDAEHLGLGARRLQLPALAEVGGEGDDLRAIGLCSHFRMIEVSRPPE